MGIEKLFEKAEKFFGLEEALQEKKTKKKRKIQEALQEKNEQLTQKIATTHHAEKKEKYKKQLEMIKEYEKRLLEGGDHS